MWTMCFVSDLSDSSIVYGTGSNRGRNGVEWFLQPPLLNTVPVQTVFKYWTPYILFAIFVGQAMFMWVVGAVYSSNCELISSYRCNMLWKVYVVGKLSVIHWVHAVWMLSHIVLYLYFYTYFLNKMTYKWSPSLGLICAWMWHEVKLSSWF